MQKQQFFYRLFEQNFSEYKRNRIAIYGMTEEAWFVLQNFPEYNFVAVLHKDNTGMFCELPIIQPTELVDMHVEIVIIVARNHNIAIVAERIKDICSQNDIKVFSVAGLSMYDYGVRVQDDVNSDIYTGNADWLRHSIYRGVLEQQLNEDDKLVLELFADKIRQLPMNEGKVIVDNLYDFSYVFLAPMITNFVFYIIKQLQESRFDKVLFAARDGYLIHELYKKAIKQLDLDNLPEDIYFLTSRMACITAGTTSGEDFFFLNTLPCAYDDKYMLEYRYNIDESLLSKCDRKIYPSTFEYMIGHKDSILEAGKRLRDNYNTYIKKAGIINGQRCAFVDLVSSGTCQMMLSKFVDISLIGIYLGRYEVDGEIKRDLLPVKAMYEKRNLNEKDDWKGNYLFDHYWFMETVMTSFEPSLKRFDECGNPVFANDVRTEKDIDAVKEMHRGIYDYFTNYMNQIGKRVPQCHSNISDILYRYSGSEFTENRVAYFQKQTLFEDLGLGILNAQEH